METPRQNFVDLFPRMDDEEMKKGVQEVHHHRHFSGYPEVKEQLLKDAFGD